MDAAQKSFELQAHVRQNAEQVKNVLNDLYSWEKEIKDKEKKLQSQPESNAKAEDLSLPVRTHIKELNSKKLPVNSNSSTSSTPSGISLRKYNDFLSPSCEKHDMAGEPLELKHKEANEIKDRGNKHVKLAEYTKAVEAYTQAIELYPEDAVYYSNRSLCYLKLERYDDCIEDCEQAIDLDRLTVKAYYRRMMANESLGNNLDALKDCTTVLMIEPKNIEAKRSLERINERLRKTATSNGPNFSPLTKNITDILPIDKPAYKRSTKPLIRIAVSDIVCPKDNKNNDNLTISDEDIDKLFNSNCGHFEEIKEPIKKMNNVKEATNVPKEISAEMQEEKPVKVEEKKNEKLSTVQKQEDSNKLLAASSNQVERPLPNAPTTTAQFYSIWKELTAQQKYEYLKSIPLAQLCKVLGAGFDSDTLNDIVCTLRDYYLMHKDEQTAATLLEVSKNKQVSILSLLMSNEERKALSDIFNSLKETNSVDTVSAEQIMKNFNLN